MFVTCQANMASFYKGIHNANTQREKIAVLSSSLFSLALFIISCVALITVLKGDPIMQGIRNNIGWITCGLGASAALAYFIAGKKGRPVGISKEVIQTIILLTLGLLGGLSVISADQVAYGVMGTFLITGYLLYGCGPCVIGCGKSIGLRATGAIDSEQQHKLLNEKLNKYRSDDNGDSLNSN